MAETSQASRTSADSIKRFLIPDLPTTAEVIPYVRRIDEARWYSNFGPLVREFEDGLLRLLTRADGTPRSGLIHLTTLASGHHALEVALHLLGIARGKRVLLPAVTFPSCPLAVMHTGGEAILADIDPTTWTLTPQIARAVASRMKIDAVMPVALYGVPIPTLPWDQFSEDTGIPIIFDAAAAVEMQQIPKFGYVAHSFHATKPFGIGEGGLLASRNAKFIEKTRRYSNFGTVERICHMDGSNVKMSEYHAAVGLTQLGRWDGIKSRRNELRQLYLRHLEPIMELLSLQPGLAAAVVSLFVLMLKQPIAGTVLRGLMGRGVATHRSYLPPLYHHPHFANSAVTNVDGETVPLGTSRERQQAHMPYSERMLQHLIGIPFHPFMSEIDVETVVGELGRQLQEK